MVYIVVLSEHLDNNNINTYPLDDVYTCALLCILETLYTMMYT